MAELGYQVTLICPDAEEGIKNGVKVLSVESAGTSRIKRMVKTTKAVYQEALKLDADIYHFHDPELLRYGKKLSKKGKKVIYDSHEDVPADILDKEWLKPSWLRTFVSRIYNSYEKKIIKKLSAVISVTPPITAKFDHPNATTVHNYPMLSNFQGLSRNVNNEKLKLIYSGGLTEVRGIKELILALELVNFECELILAGKWNSEPYRIECESLEGWKKVSFKGFITLEENYQLMSSCHVGLVNFMPIGNHLHSLPNKAFEYFACGLVVQMSDFKFWRNEFGDNAKYHNPKAPKDIAEKLTLLNKNISDLVKWGAQGKQFIVENRSWESQVEILDKLYQKILD